MESFTERLTESFTHRRVIHSLGERKGRDKEGKGNPLYISPSPLTLRNARWEWEC